MENVFLFLFRTFVDFITIVLILRLIASRWISANNPIHQSIVLITSPIIRPFTSRFSKQWSLEIILIGLCLLIELFALWFMTTINCLNGPNFLQLIGLSTMKLMILVLRIFFISILAHVILTWLSPNSFTPATRFIGDGCTSSEADKITVALPCRFRLFATDCSSNYPINHYDYSYKHCFFWDSMFEFQTNTLAVFNYENTEYKCS